MSRTPPALLYPRTISSPDCADPPVRPAAGKAHRPPTAYGAIETNPEPVRLPDSPQGLPSWTTSHMCAHDGTCPDRAVIRSAEAHAVQQPGDAGGEGNFRPDQRAHPRGGPHPVVPPAVRSRPSSSRTASLARRTTNTSSTVTALETDPNMPHDHASGAEEHQDPGRAELSGSGHPRGSRHVYAPWRPYGPQLKTSVGVSSIDGMRSTRRSDSGLPTGSPESGG